MHGLAAWNKGAVCSDGIVTVNVQLAKGTNSPFVGCWVNACFPVPISNDNGAGEQCSPQCWQQDLKRAFLGMDLLSALFLPFFSFLREW